MESLLLKKYCAWRFKNNHLYMPVNKGVQKINLNIEINVGQIKLETKALFAKHLAIMQKAGLTLIESLEIILESATGKFKHVLTGVLKSIESGNTLSSSFSRYPKVFNSVFISSIYAGESSGTLDQSLENLAVQLEKERELHLKIKGAMLYPSVVLSAAFILGSVLSFLVLPKIIPLFEGLNMKLPFTTRLLISFSHFMERNGTFVFVGLILFLVFMFWLVKQKFVKPFTHLLFLKIPIVKNIVKNANLARFSRTLGMLLKSGLSIDSALQVTRDTMTNYYYAKSLSDVSIRVSKGVKLSENLEQYNNLYPKMVSKMILVGEESGRLDETLLYLSDYYDLEVDNSAKTLSTAIEPILLIIIGLVVGFLALSIITPIYSITGNIRR